MIKRQRILIIVFIAVFAALLIAYFTFLRPLLAEPAETGAETVDAAPGEVPVGDTIYLFEQIERADMQKIEVHNSYGTYSFSYDPERDDFTLDGYPNLAFNPIQFSSLVVSTGTTLAISKITDNATDDQLREYGLRDEDDPAYYTLTERDGTSHTVTIGKKIISGGGFYAMCDGRSAIYILGASLEETILARIEDMISPLLTAGVSETEYYSILNMAIYHYGEKFISFRSLSQQELAESESNAMVKIVTDYPAEYSTSYYHDNVLQLLSTYQGDSIVALGLTEENLEKYGLADEPYVITYEYQGIKIRLVASEPVDGWYYVGTSIFDYIVKVSEEDFSFLKWDLTQWIESRVFMRGIQFVNNIKIESEQCNEVFRLYHHPNDDPNLTVIGDNCGEITDIPNFRNFYKTLLLTQIMDYAPEDIEVTEDDCILKFTVTTNGGNVTEYGFYRYSTRRCLLTINGEGQFYVLIDTPEKIISDAIKVINGIEVDSEAKN